MRNVLSALVTGTLFGGGLALSDMINPARVLAFLDVAGEWDPTLGFVMAAALLPSAMAYLLVRSMRRPLLHPEFHIPENRIVDRNLVLGGLIFGAGWGLVGYCPGPAVAGLALGTWQTWVFAIAMIAGMASHRIWAGRRPPSARRRAAA